MAAVVVAEASLVGAGRVTEAVLVDVIVEVDVVGEVAVSEVLLDGTVIVVVIVIRVVLVEVTFKYGEAFEVIRTPVAFN